MKKLTKEQIETIERELSCAWGSVELLCDDYRVKIDVQRVRTRTYALALYVNGWFKGEWLCNECEERRRFIRPKTISLYSPRQRAQIVKAFGKRAAAKHFPDLDAKRTIWSPYWTSVRSMLRHFCANNQRVEVVAVGTTEITWNLKSQSEVADA